MNKKNILFYLLLAQCTQFISLQAAFPEWFKYFATASGGQFALEIIKSAPNLPILNNFINEDEQTALNRKHTEQQMLSNDVQTLAHIRQLITNNDYFKKLSMYEQLIVYRINQITARNMYGIGAIK
jgi:hypothetical protein